MRRLLAPPADLTPPSIALPKGWRSPPPPDDVNVISGRALLSGRQHEHELLRSVDDEVLELDDPLELEPGHPWPSSRRESAGGAPSASTVLFVGSGFSDEPDVTAALEAAGFAVERAWSRELVDAIIAYSPALVVLTGDASRSRGARALDLLRHSPMGASVPVAVLCERQPLTERLHAYQSGATELVPVDGGAQEIAASLSALAARRAAPDGETSLGELVDTLSTAVKTALLTGDPPDSERSVRVLLHTERDVARLVDGFVSRLRGHVTRAGGARAEPPPSPPTSVRESASPEPEEPDVRGLRVLIADADADRAELVARVLSARGAWVLTTDLEPEPECFEQQRQLDPVAILMATEHVDELGLPLLGRARRDPRLRWGETRAVDFARLLSDPAEIPSLLGVLEVAADAERRIFAGLESEGFVDLRLERLGPARLLRLLSELPFPTRVAISTSGLSFDAELAGGRVGARATLSETARAFEGPSAVAALLRASSGRVHVERSEDAPVGASMLPLAVVLHCSTTNAPPSEPVTEPVEPSTLERAPELEAALSLPEEPPLSLPDVPFVELPKRRRIERLVLAVAVACACAGFFVHALVYASADAKAPTLRTPAPSLQRALPALRKSADTANRE